VRAISLDDGHVFCAPEQASGEVARVLRLMRRIHDALGVRVAGFRLSLPAPGGGYVDDPELWPRAEAMLRAALEHAGVAYVEAPGHAAFYGPKVDVQILDAAGRDWTL